MLETPVTRRQGVLDHVRADIVAGRMAPGTVIRDSQLAAELGVSITPVREAVVQLVAEGLVDMSPHGVRRVTRVTQKSALELADVMTLLARAGFERGVENLTDADMARLRDRYQAFESAMARGDVRAAAAAGSDFGATVITAAGNRELQNHIDLVVHRTLRLHALTPTSDLWAVWLHGYRDILACLAAGDRRGAVERYGRIYAEYRHGLELRLQDEDFLAGG